jgi:DNA-binding LacI/PurR family transcriptional regulator
MQPVAQSHATGCTAFHMVFQATTAFQAIPTIKQVAEAAGVSRATVSRSFGAPHLLKPETVERVRAAADRLGYVPNHTARALSTGRAGNIALVVPDITNPFFSAVMRGAQRRARDEGYAIFVGDSDETPDLEDVLLSKLAAQVEGFILISPRLSQERIQHHAARRPLVLINSDAPSQWRLLVDSGPSYARAVEHLASQGHRSLAYVAGPGLSWSNGQRAQAVSEASRRLGLRLVEVPTCRPSFEAGQGCIARLLEGDVTAALAFDDAMAQGIMAGLGERGIMVPRDFSVVGCDGVIATTTYPPLTSIDLHCVSAGERAAEMLMCILRRSAPGEQRLVLASELIVRASTGPARSSAESPGRPAKLANAGAAGTQTGMGLATRSQT